MVSAIRPIFTIDAAERGHRDRNGFVLVLRPSPHTKLSPNTAKISGAISYGRDYALTVKPRLPCPAGHAKPTRLSEKRGGGIREILTSRGNLLNKLHARLTNPAKILG